jgi:hypothetical protein
MSIATKAVVVGDVTVLLDQEDFDQLAGRSIYLGSNGYAYFSTHATGPRTLHSFVMEGRSSREEHVDHINGNKLDNRKANLRSVSPQVNQVNRKRLSAANTSGHRGVARTNASQSKPWRAQITARRKNIHLGLFATLEEAIEARRMAELSLFGEECPR